MRNWSDDTFDWNSLNDAINYMHNYMLKYGRIGVHSKEKYGTARLYISWFYSLHSLTHPGYVYSQYPKWLWYLDVYYFPIFFRRIGATYLINKWQFYIYAKAYHNAIRKWPHIEKEITCAADYKELIYKQGNIK